MQFGLDDKVMDDVRRQHKVGGTAQDVEGGSRTDCLCLRLPVSPKDLRRW
jgi:hypothetical protein